MDMSGPQFVELMERFGVTPSELKITPGYKNKLKNADRRPSRELVARLCLKIIEKHSVTPPECREFSRVAGPGGFEPPTAGLGERYSGDASHKTVMRQKPASPTMPPYDRRKVATATTPPTPRVESTADYVESILSSDFFWKWVKTTYSRGHYYHIRKKAPLLLKVLEKPGLLAEMPSRSYAETVLKVAGVVKKFCEAYGRPVPQIDTKSLRKFLPRKQVAPAQSARWLSMLRGDDVDAYTNVAMSAVKDMKEYGPSARKLFVATAFFTGLRGTEIIYMVNNWRRLPKEQAGDVVVVELAYDRGPKKAYITIMPAKLAEMIDRFVEAGGRMGQLIVNNTYRYYKVQVKKYRKIWVTLTMRAGMDEAWRDALQGRIPSIQVKHYVENIQDAIEHYKRAFEAYMKLL